MFILRTKGNDEKSDFIHLGLAAAPTTWYNRRGCGGRYLMENGTFYCMDPLRDSLTPLSRYGNRVYAVRCVYLD